MKHLKLFFALFAMLALGVTNAWGAETLYKNALFKIANCTNNSSYTGKVTCTIGDDSWVAQNAANNNGGWDYVKIGAKKSKASDPTKVTTGTITTNAAYAEAVSKIVVNGQKDRGSFTSKLIIASNSSFTTDKVEITGATSFTNKQIVFEIESPSANKYYKLEFVCSNTTTTNGVIQVSSVEYYYEPSTEETVVSVPTFSVPEGTFYSPINVELSCSTPDAEIHYTLDGSTPSSTSEKYTTAIAISETTTVKAIAVKDGLTDSEVATATYTKGETVTSYDIDFETNALEAYVNWDFSNITITTTTIKAKAGTYYANTSGKASASIKTKEKIQYPGILTFSVSKESTNTTASNWLVQVSENGTTWSTVGTISATEMTKGNWKDHSVDLSDYENVYVQISYGSSTAVRAIDEISIAQGVAPVKYTLTIESPENGTLLVTNGGASVASGDQFKAGTSLVVTPTPATGYVFESLTVDGSAVELTDGTYTFNMPATNVTIAATFKENEKTPATLTLSKNGVEETFPGSWKQDDVVTLPSITSDCVKEFVGWSANANCAIEPEYKAGDEYTLAETAQTLYAVYATVGGGGNATATNTIADNGWTNEKQYKSLQIDANVTASVTGGGNTGKYYTSGNNWRLYQTESATITISTTLGELKSVKFTFTNSSDGTLLYNSTALTSNVDVEVSGNSAVFTVGDTHATENKGQIRISKIEVVYTGGVTYSDYSTACSAALANPTFSLAEGKYTEAKSVEIEYTEGTVYYTMDGTEPTASSTEYTAAIALNVCGEYTIKAIAISSNSQSDVVSATYTIKLPLTNSQAAPYTEAEAIAVYDGGCYDNQDVYVKGTVKTATFYNSGTYTITLTNGYQFYKFYKDGSKTLFADGEINKGDVLVACGKLSKYNTTYQLAEGCYLVEHEPYTEPKTDISNTEATAYTVDKAFELIADPSSDLTKEVYVKGLVAVAPTSNPTADGQMTYKISDNGENTGNVLTVYLGLNLNGEKFTSKNDVQQGDYVVVKGKLLDYYSTYELNKGNQLVQHLKAATISIADITMEVGETKTIAATITPAAAETKVAYSIKAGSDDCITLTENKITAKAEGTATIVATIATAEGEYMGKTVEFKVTVTPVNIATLPFYFDGGVGDIATTLGMSQKNLGSDYTSAGSPKLKFDDTDDNVIIHFDSEPVELSFTLKQNGDDGATYTVYESEDGNTFSPVWVAGEIGYGKTQDVTVSLSDAARYVKFEYTYKIPGTNYALGKISITNTYSTPTTLSGKFSTGKYEYAEFATGNLQYKKEGENETWRFAKQQYQYVGEANINVGDPAFEGWIDMFGWSTSETNYGVDPRNENVYYDGAFVDWSNLFPGEGWSTLSADQWKYLLNTRPNAEDLKQIARVGSVVGIMLFPDNWNAPLTVTAERDSYFNVDIHNYNLEQWAALENAGALFLPAAGRRTGGYGNMINKEQVEEDNPANLNGGHYKHQDNTNIYCYYWTSTINEDKNVSYLHNIQALGGGKYTIGTGAIWGEKGRYGQSVRLAKVTTTLIEIGDGNNSTVIAANKDKKVNVKVNRTFKANDGYYTICLPFNIDADEIGKAYQINTITEHVAGEGINVEFTPADILQAGQPYLLLPSKDLENPIFEGVTIVNTTGDATPTVSGEGINITFTGIINGGGNTNGSTDYYVGDNGYLYNGTTEKLGLRAFFTITDNEGNPAKVRARVVVGENTTTDLENILNGENTTIKVIENGQLIIIRNGEKFNAQGQKL